MVEAVRDPGRFAPGHIAHGAAGNEPHHEFDAFAAGFAYIVDVWQLGSRSGVSNQLIEPVLVPLAVDQAGARTLELVMRVLEAAPCARTTVQSPQRWAADAAWKASYNNVAALSAHDLARLRAEFDRQKDAARASRGAPD